MFFALIVWAIFADDETETESDNTKQDSTVVQQPKDSVVVNEPLEGDPYEELDELIGLENVKEEVRSLANFVKIQKQREAQGLKTAKVSYHLVFYGSPGTGKTTWDVYTRTSVCSRKDTLWRLTAADSLRNMWDRLQ